MASVEQAYSYLAPSRLEARGKSAELMLATSGGRAEHPHFFSGFLGLPRQTAQALLVVAEVARTRYYEPPGMIRARIAAADPVVTSNVDRLRFESFSACCGVYARLDLEPSLFEGAFADWGTTNVDFNPPMRAALAGVVDADAMLVHVGEEELRVTTTTGSAVERKVALPERWLKGFAEVQVASARMVRYHDLPAVEARRFLQSIPRPRSASVAWAAPTSGGLRLSALAYPGAVCVAAPHRLRLLERLLPFASSLRTYGLPAGDSRSFEPSGWELVLEGARVVFVFSPELYRGFSGEGAVLSELAAVDDDVADAVSADLHGQPSITVDDAVKTAGSRQAAASALAALAAAGRVGYDLAAGSYFHRELPFDAAVLAEMHPRLLGARRLVDEGGVTLDDDGATVTSDGVQYRVRLTEAGARCTCPWFARHAGERGPCKHVLAAEHARRVAAART